MNENKANICNYIDVQNTYTLKIANFFPIADTDSSPKPELRNSLPDGGLSLSPSCSERNFNFASYDLSDLQQVYSQPGTSLSNRVTYHAPSPVDQQRLSNQNNNVGHRNRSHSQTSYSVDRTHRPVPNTYTEEERQMHYRQLKLKRETDDKLRNQILAEKFHDNEISHRRSAQIAYLEKDFSKRSHESNLPEIPLHLNNGTFI